MSAETIARGLEGKREGRAWRCLCPVHQGHALIVQERESKILVHCHAGCDQETVIAALRERGLWEGGEGASMPPKFPATVQPLGCTLAEYAAAKGLPVDFLRSLGLSEITYQSAPAVRIPYLDPDGTELAARFRIGLTGDNRFRWKSGARVHLYGLNRLGRARDEGYVVLVEGESDCHVAWHHGLPSVGVPGASNFREDRDAVHLEELDIYLVVEPDRGGAALVETLARSRLRDRVHLVSLPGFKDLADMHVADPTAFRPRWEAARAAAAPLTWELLRRARERREVAARDAKALIHKPDILGCFAAELLRLRVVGEERAAKIIFLSIISRLLDRPISVVVKGPSSAGKSFIVEQVLRFVPETAFYALTGMSEHALAYGSEPLSHRMLVVYEAAGLSSDFASFLIRSLLSEGHLRYETVVKTPAGLESRLIEREGPTGLIVTTTAVNLHAENETRLLSVSVSDTNEQTAAVLQALAGDGAATVEFGRWHALQDWLVGGDVRVAIPYASALARLVPPVAVRLRRDFRAVLTLIRAHALLHQASRDLDTDGRIVATLGDYAVVRDLVAELVSDIIGATVSRTMRETVAAVEELATVDEPEVSITNVAKHIKLDKSAVQRRVRAAVDRGFLRNLEDRRGRPARLVLGDPLPGDTEVLPSPERLQGCSDCEGGRPPSPPKQATAEIRAAVEFDLSEQLQANRDVERRDGEPNVNDRSRGDSEDRVVFDL